MLKTVLVVDDSAMMRKIVMKLLKEADYEVIGQASGGQQAIQRYQELKPDFVTMDITMPDMDGISAGVEIMTFSPDAKILFMSNLEGDKYRDEVARIGGLGIVKKHGSEALDILKQL